MPRGSFLPNVEKCVPATQPGGDMALVHRFSAIQRFAERPRTWGRGARFAFTALRALRMPAEAVRATLEVGGRARRQSGRSVPLQIADQLSLALGSGVSPLDYYRFGLFLDRRRRLADQYLYQHEVAPLQAGLGRPDVREVGDKIRFAAICRAAGLPVVSTLAVFLDGHVVAPSTGWTPAHADVFVKPVTGSHGRGTAMFERLARDRFRDQAGREWASTDVVARVAEQSVGAALLVQPRVRTHPLLSDLTLGALVTLRIVTILGEGGAPEHLVSVLKIPVGTGETDNLGLASPVDELRGCLGRALSYRSACEGMDVHPDTSAQIRGRSVPCWIEARDLAVRAHRSFPAFFTLGWDVAVTPDGPVLIEANAGWDTGTVQRPHDRPLGHTRFGALAAARIARRSR